MFDSLRRIKRVLRRYELSDYLITAAVPVWSPLSGGCPLDHLWIQKPPVAESWHVPGFVRSRVTAEVTAPACLFGLPGGEDLLTTVPPPRWAVVPASGATTAEALSHIPAKLFVCIAATQTLNEYLAILDGELGRRGIVSLGLQLLAERYADGGLQVQLRPGTFADLQTVRGAAGVTPDRLEAFEGLAVPWVCRAETYDLAGLMLRLIKNLTPSPTPAQPAAAQPADVDARLEAMRLVILATGEAGADLVGRTEQILTEWYSRPTHRMSLNQVLSELEDVLPGIRNVSPAELAARFRVTARAIRKTTVYRRWKQEAEANRRHYEKKYGLGRRSYHRDDELDD